MQKKKLNNNSYVLLDGVSDLNTKINFTKQCTTLEYICYLLTTQKLNNMKELALLLRELQILIRSVIKTLKKPQVLLQVK